MKAPVSTSRILVRFSMRTIDRRTWRTPVSRAWARLTGSSSSTRRGRSTRRWWPQNGPVWLSSTWSSPSWRAGALDSAPRCAPGARPPLPRARDRGAGRCCPRDSPPGRGCALPRRARPTPAPPPQAARLEAAISAAASSSCSRGRARSSLPSSTHHSAPPRWDEQGGSPRPAGRCSENPARPSSRRARPHVGARTKTCRRGRAFDDEEARADAPEAHLVPDDDHGAPVDGLAVHQDAVRRPGPRLELTTRGSNRACSRRRTGSGPVEARRCRCRGRPTGSSRRPARSGRRGVRVRARSLDPRSR